MTNAAARPGRRPRRSSSSGERPGGGLNRADREPEAPADPEAAARSIVLRQLSTAARTRAELATTLAKRNVPADVAERVLDRMTEVGLIDDANYAQEWVRQRQQGRGLARRALAHELRRKGIDDDLAAAALAGVDDEVERASALDLAVRKARSSRGAPHDKRVRQLTGMLARKGYASGVVYAVVREALAAEGEVVDLVDGDPGRLD